VYGLDVAGQRLVDLNRGRRPRRPRPVGRAHLDHSLAITQVFVDLTAAERARQLAVVQFVGGSAAWRSFHGPGGARVILKPDAYVVVRIGGYEDHWFLEVDLGTEHLPALARRQAVYLGYWQSGIEQAKHEVFPRVLWLVPDQHRADSVAGVIARQPADVRSLFAVSLHAEAVTRMLQGAGP
jgi:Replication-relaxation